MPNRVGHLPLMVRAVRIELTISRLSAGCYFH